MKKIVCLLLLITCMFAICSCDVGSLGGLLGDGGDSGLDLGFGFNEPVSSMPEIIAGSKPVTVTTLISYQGEDLLEGRYVTKTDGTHSVFEYEYDRYATVAEMSPTRIKTVNGKVYYRNGQVFATEGEGWVSSDINQIVDFNLRIDEANFATYKLTNGGKTLNGTVKPENSEIVLGSAIAATGDIAVEIITNGTYLYYINISYTSANGAAVTINTSYEYSPVVVEVPGA